MLPGELQAESFKAYPPEARGIATKHMDLFRNLPLGFLPLLLRELIAYDWKFPAERREIDNQLAYLGAMMPEQLRQSMASFAQLRLSAALEHIDWVNAPAQFSEELTAHLWTTNQIDAFRAASVDYIHKLNAAVPAPPLPIGRLGIAVIGQGVQENRYALFRKLRPHGVYFTNVNPENGWATLLTAANARAAAHPISFGHWYIDGSNIDPAAGKELTCIAYNPLGAVRDTLVTKMRRVMQPGGGGPEVLRTVLAQMRPEDLGLSNQADAAVLDHFQIRILTEGSGTQLFSTTFVQWSAREALRRAQPVTLLARFAPRQHEQSMRELLAGTQQMPVPDPSGSLIDADMGAYYTWINQQRLAGAEQASFLVWFENHNEALAVSPSLKGGTRDSTGIDLQQLLKRIA